MTTGYTALALLPKEDQAQGSETILAALLESAGATQIITGTTGRTTSGAWEGWRIFLAFNEDASVLQEAQEIAEEYGADRHDCEIIAHCPVRIEVWSEAGPEMQHFNDYIGVLMEIEARFPSAILFDAANGVFI